jgi:hypothetical protein
LLFVPKVKEKSDVGGVPVAGVFIILPPPLPQVFIASQVENENVLPPVTLSIVSVFKIDVSVEVVEEEEDNMFQIK